MTPLTVIARLKAKDGSEEKLGAMLRALVAPTRAEKGCINYDLHRSHDDPGLFIFYEKLGDPSALGRPYEVASSRRIRRTAGERNGELGAVRRREALIVI